MKSLTIVTWKLYRCPNYIQIPETPSPSLAIATDMLKIKPSQAQRMYVTADSTKTFLKCHNAEEIAENVG